MTGRGWLRVAIVGVALAAGLGLYRTSRRTSGRLRVMAPIRSIQRISKGELDRADVSVPPSDEPHVLPPPGALPTGYRPESVASSRLYRAVVARARGVPPPAPRIWVFDAAWHPLGEVAWVHAMAPGMVESVGVGWDTEGRTLAAIVTATAGHRLAVRLTTVPSMQTPTGFAGREIEIADGSWYGSRYLLVFADHARSRNAIVALSEDGPAKTVYEEGLDNGDHIRFINVISSPDGRYLALDRAFYYGEPQGRSGICLFDLTTDTLSQVTAEGSPTYGHNLHGWTASSDLLFERQIGAKSEYYCAVLGDDPAKGRAGPTKRGE